MTSNEIRKAFLDFFAKKNHHVVPSAPMVVKGDPTLMFTNAGMNQFKDIFLGNSTAPYPRATDSQKCLRVSGKHNDLEEVGHDTYHHTMFEMLGNWSFGDYFKEEAIAWAWEFLTEVMHIDKENLYVTIFGGDEKEGLTVDEEARTCWLKHIDADRILLGSKKDNFWEMGDQGPCGPCSEIHIDLRDKEEKAIISGKDLVNKDNPLVIEIWNLVFMQYNRLANGMLEPLSAHHIDTGMGFERLCMVMQGVKSNYDTDVFQPLLQEIAKMSNKRYGESEREDIAMRVIADHLRAVSFSIADGQLPSNAKAGYVIRRILRRAVRYGYTFLGFDKPFMYMLVPTLVGQMGEQYGELKSQQKLIENIIFEEEQSFLRTLASGIRRFEDYKCKDGVVDGAFAFELFDTYGFPIDLTQLMASERGWKVDMEGFETGLQEQKNRSRAAATVENDDWVELIPDVEQKFVGYDITQCDVQIVRYRRQTSKNKTSYQLIFDTTPFYGEGGGQAGDKGYIDNGSERIEIVDTKKENGLSLHIVERLPKDMTGSFVASVDKEKREATACNHTATHLLHLALREVLGTHVEQKGSSVDSQRLRFDFSHFSKLSADEIKEVERKVNAMVRECIELDEHRDMPIEEARGMGAMALFGEKYGERVRVVRYGKSVELCGGTHVSNTGKIGLFKITSESAIAAGMRRIEAVTSLVAEEYVDGYISLVEGIKERLKGAKDIIAAVEKMQQESKEMQEAMEKMRRERAKSISQKIEKEFENTPIWGRLVDYDINMMKDEVIALCQKHSDKAIVMGSTFAEKPSLMIALGQEYVERGGNAGAIIRQVSSKIKGGGGGNNMFATAGGKDCEGVGAAIDEAVEILNKI